MKPIEWHGCYQDSWKGIITDAAFAHPAKFSRALVERIITHLENRGFLEAGDTIGDPFGGVGTGGIIVAYRGYKWIGVELEDKFVELAAGNFFKHVNRWQAIGVPWPTIRKGDSRQFDQHVEAIMTSPPYVSGGHHTDVMNAGNQNGRGQGGDGYEDLGFLSAAPPERSIPLRCDKCRVKWTGCQDAAECPRCGDVTAWMDFTAELDALISSPAYSGSLDDGGPDKAHPDGYPRSNQWIGYGKAEGQIATLKTGDVDAVVTSQPFLGARSDTTSSGGGINRDGYEGKDPPRPSHARMGERTYQSRQTKEREPENIEVLTPGEVETVLGFKLYPWQEKMLDACISSPPYETIHAGAGGLNHLPAKEEGQQSGRAKGPSQEAMDHSQSGYGDAPGQIANTKKGPVDAILTSPAYADSVDSSSHGIDFSKSKPDYRGRVNHPARNAAHSDAADRMRYGDSPGQIGSLPAVVSSPPWEKNVEGGRAAGKFKGEAVLKSKRGKGATDKAVKAQAERDEEKTLGDSEGQIGQTTGETYWEAMAQVYLACFRSLKPGGVMAIVVKDFVKDKKRMCLCDDTMKLLVWCGFTEVERIHAMLVHEETHPDLFFGKVVKKTERKSFFRRLHELGLADDDSRRIDYEEVLIVQKPKGGMPSASEEKASEEESREEAGDEVLAESPLTAAGGVTSARSIHGPWLNPHHPDPANPDTFVP